MTPDRLALVVWSAVAPDAAPPPDGPPRMLPATEGPGWRSPVALRLAPSLGRSSRDLAHEAAARLRGHPDVGSVQVLGYGMLEVVLTPRAAGIVVTRVMAGETEVDLAVLTGRFATPPLPGPGRRRRDDPVFAVVWAHARARTVLSLAAGEGIGPAGAVGDLLAGPAEMALLTALAAFPHDVSRATRTGDAGSLLLRLVGLAGRTHDWLDLESVVPWRKDEPVTAVHHARVALAAAAAACLVRGLRLLDLPRPVRV
ncbi:MAG: DALR anticodon-binding domain-containing protein [Actinomycetota bacterium]|nr:DALR anticodon-binding domain-containing protein [Actinomycetota bacterium]